MDNNKEQENKIKDIEKNVSVNQTGSSPIDFFVANPAFVFIYKKTEKLATALYMVTNLFDDVEPIKWTLRSKISNLLSFIIGFKDIASFREEEFSHDVHTRVLEIVSLLEIAARSGLVSSMNFSILKAEFVHMLNFLVQTEGKSLHRTDLKEQFFEVGKPPVSFADRQKTLGISIDYQGQKPINPFKRSNRQNIIISLLKRKKEIVIQDVAEVISDCSEKTIQRELGSLVDAGVVKKTGQRRWTKYSLVIVE